MTIDEFPVWIRQLGIPGYGDDEVRFMAATVLLVRPTVVYDWGTNRGSSSRILWEAMERLDVPGEVHTVELPDELAHLDRDHPGVHVGVFLEGTTVQQHRGDGVEVALSHLLEHPSARPLFFVDGDHSYANVCRELQLVGSIAPAATILCHDSRHITDVRDAIYWFLVRTPRTGGYLIRRLASQAGMTRLHPRS